MLKANSDSNIRASAELFAALGDGTRLQLVDRMSGGHPTSIIGLSAGMKLSRQGITKHLRVLENAGIVRSARVGRELQFSLQPKALNPLKEYLELVSTQWDDAIERLRLFVEEE